MENQTKQGLRGQKTEKAALLSPLIAHRLWPQPDGRVGELRVGRHINLASTHNPCGAKGRPGVSRGEHTRPTTKRAGQ